jgi:catechol 2,3-dioxygenase-like lactoylglutathione lyase family enzyme
MIRSHMYVLAVPDLDRSSAFYRDVLGFSIHEMGDPGWRLYSRDACRIMAGECPDALPPSQIGDHGFFAYLVVDDVEDWHRRVVAQHVEITKPITNEPWRMREFGLRTIDGHRIMIGQELPPA